MRAQQLWLGAAGLAGALATLGVLGLLAHLDEGRDTSVIAFDVLWIVGTAFAGVYCWQRFRAV